MKNIALITGASSGIGWELAKIHASLGGDLILVARREDRLQKLKNKLEEEYDAKVVVLSEDLTQSNASQRIYDYVEKNKLQVDILVNNAGFGGHGKFFERDFEIDKKMIQLNIIALTELTRLFLPKMVERNKGKILNVSSTAGFIPGPLQAVYFATKAYVNSFSQAIAYEVRKTNVTITTLCPGPVSTEFGKVADLEGTNLIKGAKSAYSVAMCGYKAMLKGRLIVINEWKLKIMLFFTKFTPKKISMSITEKMQKKN